MFALASCWSKSGVAVGQIGSNVGNSISEKYEFLSRIFTKEFSIEDGETATAT